MMMDELHNFSALHHSALKVYFQGGANLSNSAITDVNHAYIGIKLWLLLAVKVGELHGGTDVHYVAIWNELWPPFQSLVNILEIEVQVGGQSVSFGTDMKKSPSITISKTLATLTWSTIAELFLFLQGIKIPIAMRTFEQTTLLERLKSLYRGEKQEAQTNKVGRSKFKIVAQLTVL